LSKIVVIELPFLVSDKEYRQTTYQWQVVKLYVNNINGLAKVLTLRKYEVDV